MKATEAMTVELWKPVSVFSYSLAKAMSALHDCSNATLPRLMCVCVCVCVCMCVCV